MFKNISGLLMLALAIILNFVSAKADDDSLINRVFPTQVNGTSIPEIGENGYKCYNNDVQYAPNDQQHACNIVLRPFQGMTKDEIITALEKEGLRPATPSEVAEFGLAYPEHELITTRVIALGGIFNVNGAHKALCIYYSCINTIHTDGVMPTGLYAAVPVK